MKCVWRRRARAHLVDFVLAALMSVKEMAKGITYDDPIKTRCVSRDRGCLPEGSASSRLRRARGCAASWEEHRSAAAGFALALLPGLLPLYIRLKP